MWIEKHKEDGGNALHLNEQLIMFKVSSTKANTFKSQANDWSYLERERDQTKRTSHSSNTKSLAIIHNPKVTFEKSELTLITSN
jgi:hypothetical protein